MSYVFDELHKINEHALKNKTLYEMNQTYRLPYYLLFAAIPFTVSGISETSSPWIVQ